MYHLKTQEEHAAAVASLEAALQRSEQQAAGVQSGMEVRLASCVFCPSIIVVVAGAGADRPTKYIDFTYI